MYVHVSSDNDQLQTDVMRFMAIIAFCLMAVLALVRNVAVESAERESTPPPATAEPAVVSLPRVAPEAPVPAPRPESVPEPETARSAESAPRHVPIPPRPAPEPLPMAAPPVASVPVQPPAAPARVPAPEPGLVLRFESDQDFMRLLARGDMRLYRYSGERVEVLDPEFKFVATPSPRRFHEVLAATIPDAIGRLSRARPPDSGGPLVWGVALPGRTEVAIRDHAQMHASGELVVNRYGEVRHVGP